MNHYKAHNYQMIAARVYQDLARDGVHMSSRNGPVLRLPGVTVFEIDRPWERVNTAPVRDANPFFHLMETVAMLGGHNSVRFLSFFAKNMANYSDDGETYNAFYGTRLTTQYGNQLADCAALLRDNPDDRQAVAQIWDAADLCKTTKDKACNLLLMFSVQDRKLCMTSVNRSNDSIWGIVTGANVVHLSYFQQYVAEAAGYPVGPWTHITNNLHVYTDNPQWNHLMAAAFQRDRDYVTLKDGLMEDCVYYRDGVSAYAQDTRIMGHSSVPKFQRALDGFLAFAESVIADVEERQRLAAVELWQVRRVMDYGNPWISETVLPVFLAWTARKAGWGPEGLVQRFVQNIAAPDWRIACGSWMERHGCSIKRGAHSNEQ